MNKKILSGILCGALIVASASTFVSCKDYDDDIKGVQEQVDANKAAAEKQYKEITALVESNMNKVQGQIETINGQIANLDAAYKAADAELTAAIAAENAALAALASAVDENAKQAAKDLLAVATELREKAEANAANIAAVQANLLQAKAELQASIDANKAAADASIAAINETVAAIKQAYQEADAKLQQNIDNATAGFTAEVGALEKKLNEEVAKLAAADVELENAIKAANARIDQANEDISALSKRLDAEEAYTKTLKEETIPALQKSIAGLQETIEANKKAAEASDAAIKESVAAVEKALNAVAASVAANQEAIAALKDRVADIEATIVSLKNDFAAFQLLVANQIAEVSEEVGKIAARVTANEAALVELNKAVAAEQTAREKAVKDLKKTDEQLATQISNETTNRITACQQLKKSISELKSDLEGKITNLENTLRGEITDLSTKIAQKLNSAISALTLTVEKLAERDSIQYATLKAALEDAAKRLGVRIDSLANADSTGLNAAVAKEKNDFIHLQDLITKLTNKVLADSTVLANALNDEARARFVEDSLLAEGLSAAVAKEKADSLVLAQAIEAAKRAAMNYSDDLYDQALAKIYADSVVLGTAIDGVQDNLDIVEANLQGQLDSIKGAILVINDRLDAAEFAIDSICGVLDDVQANLSHLITSIVYQGDGAQGTYVPTPSVYSKQPVIWYTKFPTGCEQWPVAGRVDSIPGTVPAVANGKSVAFYRGGFIYATLNPSTVDLTGIDLTLENSMGAANKYVKLSNVALAEDVTLTRAQTNPGFYCMKVLPTADFDSAAFVSDKNLYAIAANDVLTDGSVRKVTSSYGINVEFQTWTKQAPKVKAFDWTCQYNDGTAVLPNNVGGFGSDFEFQGTQLNVNPSGKIVLNTKDTLDNIYKWYVEFYNDNLYSQKLNPKTTFGPDYKDEVQYGFQNTKDIKLCEDSYLNKLIYVKIRAIGYDYSEKVTCHTISFSRPLFASHKIEQVFYPENAVFNNDNFDKFITAFAADSAKYFELKATNGAIPRVDASFNGFESIAFLKQVGNRRVVNLEWNPYKVAYSTHANADGTFVDDSLSNVIAMRVTDNYGHIVMFDTLIAKFATPDHLDYNIGKEGNRIPAAFNYFKKVGEENTINIWTTNYTAFTANSGVADFKFDGAFNNVKSTSPIADATTLGPKDGFNKSYNSLYAFRTGSSDLTINPYPNYIVRLNSVKNITVFGDVVNSSDYTHNAGKPVPSVENLDFSRFQQYNIYQCVDYYAMASTIGNTFYGLKHDNFKVAFLDPINYGFSEKNELTYQKEVADMPGKAVACLTFGDALQTFYWYDHSKTKASSSELDKFYLSDKRICDIKMEIDPEFTTANAGLIANFSCGYSAGSFSFEFDYTSTAINDEAFIPAFLYVEDVWGVKSKIKFTIHLVKHQL